MAHLERLGGRVQYIRLRGQKVHSYSKVAFAIERESNIPAIVGSHGDFIFSEVGAGVYPIAIVARTMDEVKIAMRSSTTGIRIEQKGDLKAEGFEIAAKPTEFAKMKHLEIHDAGVDAFKNVVLGVAGNLGGGGESLFSTIFGAGKDLVGGAFDIKDALSTPKNVKDAFGSKGSKSGLVGVVVNMYPMTGYISTGKKRVTLQELARYVFNKQK